MSLNLTAVTTPNALGEFLKARRNNVSPEQLAAKGNRTRRVAGLRSEEIAQIAGISVDYYRRIEQGRMPRPSTKVLAAVAQALELDAVATAHLHRLAGSYVPQVADGEERVAGDVVSLLHRMDAPAYVINRYTDCLAANPLAIRLSPIFTPGSNILRQYLRNPEQRAFDLDWQDAVSNVVAGWRQLAGVAPNDVRLQSLVEEFRVCSPLFRDLWDSAHVVFGTAGYMRVQHPTDGELRLFRRELAITGSGGHKIHVYQDADCADAF